MFKIGEFSKLMQVTVRMLRHYDQTGLLKPAQIDPMTGYRMYSVEQIPVLNKIIYLRDSGFQVSEIKEALHAENPTSLTELLDKKYTAILNTIEIEKIRLKKIELAKHELLDSQNELHYQVSIKSIPSCRVLSIRKIIPDYYAEGDLWKNLSEFVCSHHIAITDDAAFSIYHDTEYKEQNVDVELCVPVQSFSENKGGFIFRDTEPVPFMACTMVYGPFSNIAGAYQSFAGWLQKNEQFQMSGQNRQIVHRGPWNEHNPENFLVEIQIPLKPPLSAFHLSNAPFSLDPHIV